MGECRRQAVCIGRGVGVDNIVMTQRGYGIHRSGCFGGSSLACLSCSRTLLASHIFFCKSLFDSLAFPVIIAHASAVDYDSTAELTEHGTSGNYGNLARAVRVRQDVLRDQIILFGLVGDDFE